MISIKHKGDFGKTLTFLNHVLKRDYLNILAEYGRLGVLALQNATPVDSGVTSKSWDFEIIQGIGKVTIAWTNSNIVDGVPIAVILQYGHGTKNGGYVEGIDYINPAMKPIFEAMANEAWGRVIE